MAALNLDNESHGRDMSEDKFVVPYERNPLFTGRTVLLRTLREKLLDKLPKKYNHRIALYGMGGVGKTQCVLEYVHANRTLYDRVYWITAVDQTSLLSGFQAIARKALLPVARHSTNLTEIAEAVLLWLRQQQSWLLVIDNLDDITVAGRFLPENGPQKHTLITTRDPNTSGIPAEPFEISLLDPEDAVELLSTLSNIPILPNSTELEEANKIVDELGYLPLAIEQAAAFIREVTGDLTIFAQEYRANRKEVHRWVPKGNRPYIYCVATTWSMSFEILRSRHLNAAKLLQLLAFLNPDGILIDFLRAGAESLDENLRLVISSRSKLAETLLELEKFSLIKFHRAEGLISIHRLVQTVVSDEMTEADRISSEKNVIELCLQAFPEELTNETRSTCRQYQSQVLGALMRTQTNKTRKSAQLRYELGLFLYDDGKFYDGHNITKQAADIFSSVSGVESQENLRALEMLALFQHELGRRQEALQLYEEVLERRKKALGAEHPLTLWAMNNLAVLYHDQGRRDEALQLKEEVLERRKKVLGAEHPDTLRAMNNLATSYHDQGRRDEALQLYEEVVERRKKALGAEEPDTLRAMNNLALLYHDQGRRDEALQLKEEVLERGKKVLGAEHPDTLMAMNNLAASYHHQGRREEALQLWEEVLERRKKVLGAEHPDTLMAMNNLAVSYHHQGRREEALQLQEEVVERRKKVLGAEHPNTLVAMNNLAISYHDQGRRDEALQLQEEVLEKRKKVLGAEHPETLTAMTNLAIYKCDHGKRKRRIGLKVENGKATARRGPLWYVLCHA
jgi:tetratricopeptide (TPR) repeat protein